MKLSPPISRRSSGVLLHLSSLPGKYQHGDLGKEAFQFIDFLHLSNQQWWQMLPINPVGSGNSPYSSTCSFAGEPRYINLETLCDLGLLKKSELPKADDKQQNKRASYKKSQKLRKRCWEMAFSRFRPSQVSFKNFCKKNKHWLDDFALYTSLSEELKTTNWLTWPKELRQRQPQALKEATLEFADEIAFHKFLQFQFSQQWGALQRYAKKKKVKFIGDLPIYVSMESSDVWANQQEFLLKKDGHPTYVAGVPPDYFNKNGQLWGNALYNWPMMQKNGFKWWIRRLEHLCNQFDLIRLDHFIGFHRYWAIPAKAKSAKSGSWRLAKGDQLLQAFYRRNKQLPFIAEDLGAVTTEVTALRLKYKLPAMRVLQFAFGNDGAAADHLPHAVDENTSMYSGTHDNDTSLGWFRDAKKERSKRKPSFDFENVTAYMGDSSANAHWRIISETLKSPAVLGIIPMQDILGLGSTARMNVPGTATGNWNWRFSWDQLKKTDIKTLSNITTLMSRS